MKDYNDFKKQTPFYNRIKLWRDEGELRAEYFDEYKALSLKQIFETFDILHEQKHPKDSEEARERDRRLDALKVLISIRLELFDTERAQHLHYIIEDTVWFHILKMREQLKELTDHFKNHSHDKDKNYTEKPVW